MSALIYGAYGYTGRLIAREAVDRGLQPILAGRDEAALAEMGGRLDCPVRVAALDEPAVLRAALEGVSVVLHAAGPYSQTSPPMVRACLDTGTHYLDLTGEVAVFRRLARLDDEARSARVMLACGMGFDVVASDCIARYAAEAAPAASLLEIAIYAEGRLSQGTLKTVVEYLGQNGLVRREGALREVPPGWTSRTVDFGDRRRGVASIPEGSVVTSGTSTDVENVTAYLALPGIARALLRGSRYVQGLLQWPPLQRLLKRLVELGPPGPSPEERERGRAVVWVSACRREGTPVTARLYTPDPYTFTARASTTAVERVLDGTAPPGYQTPATAFGTDFVLDVEGVERHRVDDGERPSDARE